MSEEALRLSDLHCSIPMRGMVDCFNVSVAAGILMRHAVCYRVSRLVQNASISSIPTPLIKLKCLRLLHSPSSPIPPPPQDPPPTTSLAIPPSKKTLRGLSHMNQLLSHMITASTPLTPASLQTLMDLSPSLHHLHNLLPLLFIQFQSLIDAHFLSSLIKSCTNSNRHLQSILVYTHMTKSSLSPNLFTFPPLIKSISQLNLPSLGIPMHGCITKMGFSSDVFASTALVTMYCAFARVGEARKLFDEMPERSSVSWNAMITGYVHNRRFKEAHEVFLTMQASGAEMGEVTMVSALSACAHLGALSQGLWIHNYVRKNGLRVNVFVGTALIDMYMKCGTVDEALRVFGSMRVKNAFSWNALISGLAMNGKGEAALQAFSAMIRRNIKPDSVTFLAMLCACCHQGFVDKGRRLFVAMEKEFELQPGIEHYGCMVDLLGRAGFLEEAYELIRTMAMKPDAAVWRALLTACRIHGNTWLGEFAIGNLLELEPDNGENYILLSNILVRDCRWSEVGKVRGMMSRRGIQKTPGCSSIEIDNMVYEFVVTSQFEKAGLDEIFMKLEDMSRDLKAAGYVVDTKMVSYDLEEEEKESSMMYHSEKLALAFGLLRSQPQSTIRIVKNLRVCKDCHSYFKLVSKVYEREIVVRDRKRFHHFGEGVCSCRDYW